MEENLCILTSVGMEQLLRGLLCVPKGSKPTTTNIVKSAVERRVQCTYPLECVEFTSKEMEQYCHFYYGNTFLRSIGFNDGSALYYGMISQKIVLVPDTTTANLCKMFNIPYIYLLPLGITSQTGMKESQSKSSMKFNRNPSSLPLKKNDSYSNGLTQNNKSMTG